ncbi:MAG: hypothetical protein PHC50_07215, partial [Candidatus Cloacimonetes bacterium]|nr:hypothetical protein [Candidatus Cloacimonadota bacterium]
EIGKAYLIFGSKSQYNGNDDVLLRVLPKDIVPLDEIDLYIAGELRIGLNQKQIQKGLLDESKDWLKKLPGSLDVTLELECKDGEIIQLVPKSGIRLGNAFLEWLDSKKLDYKLFIKLREKHEKA